MIRTFQPMGCSTCYLGVTAPQSKWDVSLFAKNVTDKLGINYLSDPGIVNGWVSGYSGASLAQPREFGIIGRYSF